MKINITLPKKKKVYKKEDISVNLNLCWSIILYSFFGIVLLSFGFGFYLYLKVNRDSFFTIAPEVPVVDRETALLQDGLDYFKNRQEISNQVLANPAPIIDPSR